MPSIRSGCGLWMDAHLFVVTGKVDISLDLILGMMRGFMTIQTTFDADAEDIGEDEIDIMFSVMQIDLQEN